MTDIEDSAQLGVERVHVGKRRVLPIDRMADRGFGGAFFHKESKRGRFEAAPAFRIEGV